MIIYGIDLGTTNSLIGLGDQLLSGFIPSICNLQSQIAGRELETDIDALRSFKVNMSLGQEGQKAVIASSYVLRRLKKEAGISGQAKAVIAVPADFGDNQRQATVKAAELAGFEVVSLINEPTAAAIYAARDKKGLTVIFDLGGGTFDISIIDSRQGVYDVIASEGNIHLGGDNLDKGIYRTILRTGKIGLATLDKSKRFRLRMLSNHLKIRMQQEQRDLPVDLSSYDGRKDFIFTEEAYVQLMKQVFYEAVEKACSMVKDYIPGDTAFDLVLAGGSTRCPYLKAWVEAALGQKSIEQLYNPDQIVAQGTALYASLLSGNKAARLVSDVTKALGIGMHDGVIRPLIGKNSKIPARETAIIVNDVCADSITLELYQGDGTFINTGECIGRLVYFYGEVKAPYEGRILVQAEVTASGTIQFSCRELLKESVSITLGRR